jgi:hypothetical protein
MFQIERLSCSFSTLFTLSRHECEKVDDSDLTIEEIRMRLMNIHYKDRAYLDVVLAVMDDWKSKSLVCRLIFNRQSVRAQVKGIEVKYCNYSQET